MKKKFLSLTLAALSITFISFSKPAFAAEMNEELVGTSSIINNFSLPLKDQRVVMGTEDRTIVEDTTKSPYSAIGYLLIKYPNGTYTRGTAWMAADSIAMTSAHCLYNSNYGGQAVQVTFIPGRNGNAKPFSSYTSTTFYIPDEYRETESETYDYAMIKFDTKIGKITGYIKPQHLSTDIYTSDFTVSGYPQGLNNDSSISRYEQYEHTGSIYSYTDTKLYYKMDTSGGDSGAPIFYKNPRDGRYYSVGVHRGGNNVKNVGIRFTKDFIDNAFKTFKK